MSAWAPVGESLPEAGAAVSVLTETEGEHEAELRDDRWYAPTVGRFLPESYVVTHWRPAEA